MGIFKKANEKFDRIIKEEVDDPRNDELAKRRSAKRSPGSRTGRVTK